jgi:hypothetical protein
MVKTLRIRLWAKHLNMETAAGHAALNKPVPASGYWVSPPAGAHIAPYDENANVGSVHPDAIWAWVDPDGS